MQDFFYWVLENFDILSNFLLDFECLKRANKYIEVGLHGVTNSASPSECFPFYMSEEMLSVTFYGG